MSDVVIDACFVCGRSTAHPRREFDGVKGEGIALVAATCSPECELEAIRIAPRRSIQWRPAIAGYAVAVLGVITGALFVISGREMGRVLFVFGLFSAGTTRLAYPDVVPMTLARRVGYAAASRQLQWLGVGVALAAVALGLCFLLF